MIFYVYFEVKKGVNVENRFFLRKLTVDIQGKKRYNISTEENGGAMVSTGILRYDKRGEPGNLVNCPNLKNKRQQYCCYGCLSFTSLDVKIGSAATCGSPVPPMSTTASD